MPTNTTEIRQERRKFLVDARSILDAADKEKRQLTDEDRSQHDKLMAEWHAKGTEIDDLERRNDLERLEQEEHNRQKDEEERRKLADADKEKTTLAPEPGSEAEEVRSTPLYHQGFVKRLLGRGRLTDEEQRAQVAGKGEKGGYLYASEQFLTELLKDVDDATVVRQLSRTFQVRTSDSLGVPTLTDKAADAEWTSELGIPTRTTIKFGKRALTPHPLAKEIPVSKVLIKKAPDIVTIVRQELARVVAEAEENAFMTGNGAQQPLGIFTVSDDGIPAARDVSTDNTTSLVKVDNLKRAKFTLKSAYWGGAQWVMHRDIMGQIARLKDGNGRYLLQDSIIAGDPTQVLLGFPVTLSEFAPNTATTGLYAYALADFSSGYWIVDGLDVEVLRLEELYARENQDLFIIRAMVDGAPVRAEAFVRGKFA